MILNVSSLVLSLQAGTSVILKMVLNYLVVFLSVTVSTFRKMLLLLTPSPGGLDPRAASDNRLAFRSFPPPSGFLFGIVFSMPS